MNADKTEYMYFNQKADLSILYGGSLKLVDKLMCLGRRVYSTDNDLNLRQRKVWTALYWLSIIWKPKLSDKIKR